MPAGDSIAPPAPPSPEMIRAAFREVHGRRLHGFALLLTLGDRPLAAHLATEALIAGADRVDEMRHPERAAAWLRARVVRASGRGSRGSVGGAHPDPVELGADHAVMGGLSALDRRERAALIADSIERFDRHDVATIVGRDGRALDRLVARARLRFADAATAVGGTLPDNGPIASRIDEVAQRTMT